MKETIQKIINTLKSLEVNGGYDAYDKLVGCVMALESIKAELNNTEETNNG